MIDQANFHEDSPFCAGCITEALIGKKIEEDGEVAECVRCHVQRKTMSIAKVGDIIKPIFEKFVIPIDDNFEQGESPSEIIQEMIGCDYDIADSLVTYLATTQYLQIKEGGDDYYDDSRAYLISLHSNEEYVREEAEWEYAWAEFEWNVQHVSRFFNQSESDFLDNVLDPLLRGDLTKGIAPIVEFGPNRPNEYVYRGREASEAVSRKRIYENPAKELAPPPPRLRRQGRMNAAGISAFYGCGDVATCVAELRVPVGGAAVVGKFKFLRVVRLLDLRKLDKSVPAMASSWFDTDFVERQAYIAFMRGLHNIIRKPVLPGDETFDYLPTQAIAEYLANRREGLDGIIFSSSLKPRTKADNDENGSNIVLFGHAAIVAGDRNPTPFAVTSVFGPVSLEDEYFAGTEMVARRSRPVPDNSTIEINNHEPDALEPTLELVEGKTRFVRVRGIEYDLLDSAVLFMDDEQTKF